MRALQLIFCVCACALLFADTQAAKPKKSKKKKGLASEVAALRQNLTSLWSHMSNEPAVHVHMHMHGMGDVHQDMHDNMTGTHVHLHMHMEGEMMHGPSHKEGSKHHEMLMEDDGYMYAGCTIHPHAGTSKTIQGKIFLRQKHRHPLQIKIALDGFDVSQNHHIHALHVHHYGDLSKGCLSLGGHFNPDGETHGGKDAKTRHAGDWGNIMCDADGKVMEMMEDEQTSLMGPHAIVGRGIVIHEGVDDLGLGGTKASSLTGDAGGRLACCVVTWEPKTDWGIAEEKDDRKRKPHMHPRRRHKHS